MEEVKGMSKGENVDKNTTNEKDNKKEEKKSKKKIIIIIIILLLLLLLFLWWWFNRKFDVTFKYNNGLDNNTIKVRYNNKIKDKDVKDDLTFEGHTFIGYFETYYLSGKEIEKIKEDKDSEKSICKTGFKLNQDKDKCIANEEFNFKNTKIKKNKTIEAFWSGIVFDINLKEKEIYVDDSFEIKTTLSGTEDNVIMFSTEDSSIATVTNTGKVVGKKNGTTNIVVETNGLKKICKVTVVEKEQPKEEPKEEPKKEEPKKEEPKKETPKVQKDEGKISINSDKKCLIGKDKANVVATITGNALDKSVTWTASKCYTMKKVSATTISISNNKSNGCDVNGTATITAKLNNGSSSSTKINYEPTLTYTVYSRDRVVSPQADGSYKTNYVKIVTNGNATFSGNGIISTTENSVSLIRDVDTTITIKTACGQTETVKIWAEIN